MRLLFFLLAPQILGPILTDYPSVSYYCRSITIDHTKVPATQTDMDVLFTGTYSYLAYVGSGGKVQNSSGYDIRFYPSSDCSGTKLDFEIPTWGSTTGQIAAWMKVGSLSSSSDTVISIRYGESGINTDQSNKTGVWESSVKGRWHLDGSLVLTDSTSSNITLTNNGTATSTTGQIGNGASFTAASSQYLTAALDASSGTGANYTQFTVSFWARPNSAVSTYGMFQWAVSGQPQSGGPSVYARHNDTSGGKTTLYADPAGYIVVDATGTSDAWHLYTYTFDGSNYHIYFDDTEPVSAGAGTWSNANAILAYFGTGFAGYSTMLIDELLLGNSAVTLNRQKVHYNNQSSPSTFYAVGSEVAH